MARASQNSYILTKRECQNGSVKRNVLIENEHGFDPREILLPTAGGYSSDLSAEVAKAIQATVSANVWVLHVADNLTSGREFLEN
jgi:hypothetical protein